MQNRINEIIALGNGKKYIIVKQAIYKNENYYAVVGIADDEETLLEEYAILHELEYEGQRSVEKVTDLQTLKLITKYLDIISDEEWADLIKLQE